MKENKKERNLFMSGRRDRREYRKKGIKEK
jgi:hypothetical protein